MKRGFSIIEIVVAAALLSIALFALVGAGRLAVNILHQKTLEAEANFLLEEGVETIRILRDQGWTANIAPLVPAAVYYPAFDPIPSRWRIVPSDPGLIDGLFTRTVIFNDVYRRNSDDDIIDVSSPDPKTLDPGTKKVTVTVSWTARAGHIGQKSISTYIANVFEN